MTRSERIMQLEVAIGSLATRLSSLPTPFRSPASPDHDEAVDGWLTLFELTDERDSLLYN